MLPCRLPFLRLVIALAPAWLLGSAASAQCLEWDPGFGPPPAGQGLAGIPYALLVHDEGSGRALFAAGSLSASGSVVTRGVARWNGSQWSPLGNPLDVQQGSAVYALGTFDEGAGPRLFAAGDFAVPGQGVLRIGRWDGVQWTPLGSDLLLPYGGAPVVSSLARHDDGSGEGLYVAGSFYVLNSQGLSFLISRWDGTQFSPVGNGLGVLNPFAPELAALTEFDAGSGPRLYAGGRSFALNGIDAQGVVVWDGSQWNTVGGGVDGRVAALLAFDDGTGPALYAGGEFHHAGGVVAENVARWNGSSWSAVGVGLPGLNGPEPGVRALAAFDDGGGPSLYASGKLQGGVLKWTGSSWSALLSSFSSPGGTYQGEAGFNALAGFDAGAGASLFAGGMIDAIGSLPVAAIGAWHGCAGSQGAFCAGDGAVVACPCSNNGLGRRGCDNSAATGGGLLSTSGSTNPDTLLLSCSGEVASSTTLFLQGDQSLGSLPFGDGLRCIGGHLKRLYVAPANGGAVSMPGSGDPSISARSAALGDPLSAGAVRFYQAQYRDPAAGFCPAGGTFNATNAVRIVW